MDLHGRCGEMEVSRGFGSLLEQRPTSKRHSSRRCCSLRSHPGNGNGFGQNWPEEAPLSDLNHGCAVTAVDRASTERSSGTAPRGAFLWEMALGRCLAETLGRERGGLLTGEHRIAFGAFPPCFEPGGLDQR